eukprot:PhF_6_TR26225/c0_g1_i1/m.37406/K15255/PIF1; ATP-dependent DNA helicase PIF1
MRRNFFFMAKRVPKSALTAAPVTTTTTKLTQFQHILPSSLKEVYNPFCSRYVSLESPGIKKLAAIGMLPSATGFLRLTNDKQFSQLARILIRLAKQNDVQSFNNELRNFPPTMHKVLLKLARSSYDDATFTQNVAKYLADAEATKISSSDRDLLNFGEGEENLGERVPITSLSLDQQNVIRVARLGYNVYIGGPAGTGKTVVLREIIRELRVSNRLTVAITATTGVAAVNLNGFTFHHVFGCDGTRTAHLDRCDVIIIDEVSMMQSQQLVNLDKVAQRVRKSTLPFGGIQVILCGDFLQLGGIPNHPLFYSDLFNTRFVHMRLSTIHRLKEKDGKFCEHLMQLREGFLPPTLHKTVKMISGGDALPDVPDATYLFPCNKEVKERNDLCLERLAGELRTFQPQLQDVVLMDNWTPAIVINVNSKDKEVLEALRVDISERLQQSNKGEFASTVTTVYPIDAESPTDFSVAVRVQVRVLHLQDDIKKRLLVERETVHVMKQLRTIMQELDHTIVQEIEDPPVPLHIQLQLQKMVEKEIFYDDLKLKEKAIVMLRYNISKTLVNGTGGVVVGFADPNTYVTPAGIDDALYKNLTRYCDYLRILGEDVPMLPVVRFSSGDTIMVPPIEIPVGGTEETSFFTTHLLALPIQLGYAFTVHKVQGLTLKNKVIMDCVKMFDSPHLIYVGASRVQQGSQLTIRGLEEKHVQADPVAVRFTNELPSAETVNPLTLPLAALTFRKFTRKTSTVQEPTATATTTVRSTSVNAK